MDALSKTLGEVWSLDPADPRRKELVRLAERLVQEGEFVEAPVMVGSKPHGRVATVYNIYDKE